MADTPQKPAKLGVPVVLALLLVIAVLAVFVFGILLPQMHAEPQVESTVVAGADSYRERLDALLAIAQPENAEAALVKYTCTACHRAPSTIGPAFDGVAERAATRRPPMPADAYIYESIIHPSVYVVEGYQDVMLRDIGDRISDQELADILAYLLTPDAH